MAEIKVKDLPIQAAPQLTDFAITDNAAGTLTEKTTWQAIKDLIVPPPPPPSTAPIKDAIRVLRNAGAGTAPQFIFFPSNPGKVVKAVWIVGGQQGGGGSMWSNGFCSGKAEAVPPPSFIQACSNNTTSYGRVNVVNLTQGANGFTGTITALGTGGFFISWTQLGMGINIEITVMVEML